MTGLAKNIVTDWPAALPVRLISADGDTLALEVCRGSWTSTARFIVTEYQTTIEPAGVIWETIQILLRGDDIDFLLDRYAIDFEREERTLSVVTGSFQNRAWRVYELYLFVQAVCDYQTGIESAQFSQLVDR